MAISAEAAELEPPSIKQKAVPMIIRAQSEGRAVKRKLS
jgi:hypothetical protein